MREALHHRAVRTNRAQARTNSSVRSAAHRFCAESFRAARWDNPLQSPRIRLTWLRAARWENLHTLRAERTRRAIRKPVWVEKRRQETQCANARGPLLREGSLPMGLHHKSQDASWETGQRFAQSRQSEDQILFLRKNGPFPR